MNVQWRRPPRLLPILYLAFAHLALAAAFVAIVYDPRGVAGFFYHSRMLAVVHLITLGWITSSILGAFYIVGPVALRSPVPARWPDYAAFALVAIGIIGMVSHFWIAEYGGMAWSAACVALGLLVMAWRIVRTLVHAPIPRAVRAHVFAGVGNVLGAAVMGVLLAIHKVHPFLPGFVLDHVFAHAHLAAVGWAAMMVVGIGYRLLPMVLPAQMPAGARLWVTLALLQTGVSGLFVTLVLHTHHAWMFGTLIVAGFGAFLAEVVWMVRHPRPRPPAIPVPDPAVVHAAAALLSLATACGLGLWLSLAPASEATLRVATAYGVLGLVGFLAQMVVAMEGRLLPLFAWYWAFERTGHRGPVPSPHAMPWRSGQEAVVLLWLFGVPALALGLALDSVPFVRAAGWSLLGATLLNAAQASVILRNAWRRPGDADSAAP
jgi:hypothetical protein